MQKPKFKPNKLRFALSDNTTHFKLYKSGKLWVTSGIVAMAVGVGAWLSPQPTTVAASTETTSEQSDSGQQTETAVLTTSEQSATGTGDTTASEPNASTDQTVDSSAATTTTGSPASTTATTTADSAETTTASASTSSDETNSSATETSDAGTASDSTTSAVNAASTTAPADTTPTTTDTTTATSSDQLPQVKTRIAAASVAATAATTSAVTTSVNGSATNTAGTVAYNKSNTSPQIPITVSGSFSAGDVVVIYLDSTATTGVKATTLTGATVSTTPYQTAAGTKVAAFTYTFSSDVSAANLNVYFTLGGTADSLMLNGASTSTLPVDVVKNGTVVATNSVVINKAYTMSTPSDTIRRNMLSYTGGITAGLVQNGAVATPLTLVGKLSGLQYFGDYSTLVNSSKYETITAPSTVTMNFGSQLTVQSATLSAAATAAGFTLSTTSNTMTITVPAGLTLYNIAQQTGTFTVVLAPVTIPTVSTTYSLPSTTVSWTIDGVTNTVTESSVGASTNSIYANYAYNLQTIIAAASVSMPDSTSYLGILQEGASSNYKVSWTFANQSNYASGAYTDGAFAVSSSNSATPVGIAQISGLTSSFLTNAGISSNLTITFATAGGQTETQTYVSGQTTYTPTIGSASDPVILVNIVDGTGQTVAYSGAASSLSVSLIAYGDAATTVTTQVATRLLDSADNVLADTSTSTNASVISGSTASATFYPDPSIVLAPGRDGATNVQTAAASQLYNPGDTLTENLVFMAGGTVSGTASDLVGRIGSGFGNDPTVKAIASANPLTIVVVAPTNTSFADDATLLSTLKTQNISVGGDLAITHLADLNGQQVIAITGVDQYTTGQTLRIALKVNADALAGATISALNTIYIMPSDVLSQYANTTILTSDGSLSADWAALNMYNMTSGASQLGTVIASSSFTANASVQGSADAAAQVKTGTINVADDTATGKTIVYNGTSNTVSDTLTTVSLIDPTTNAQELYLTGPVTVVDQTGATVAATVTYTKAGVVVTDPTQADGFTVSGVYLLAKGNYATISYPLTVAASELTGAVAGKTWSYTTSTQGYSTGTVAAGGLTTLGAAINATLSLQAIRDLTDTWQVATLNADGTYTVDSSVATVTTTGVAGNIYNGYTLMGTSASAVGQAYGDAADQILIGVYDATTGTMVSDGSAITYAEVTDSTGAITGSTYYLVLEPRYTTQTSDVTYTVAYTGAGADTPASQSVTATWTGTTDQLSGTTTWTRTATSLALATPTLTGYTASAASEFGDVATTSATAPTAQTATVTYTPDALTVPGENTASAPANPTDPTANPALATSIVVQGATKVYDGTATTDPTTYTVLGPTLYGQFVIPTLTADDFDVTAVDQNVGTYQVMLSAKGIAALQDANPTFTFTAADVQNGLFVITPATATTTLTAGELTYDGTTTASEATGLTATAAGVSVALTAGDITVVNDGTTAGDYTYTLSATGLDALQAAVGANYTVTTTDASGTITIDPLAVTITAPTVSKSYDGTAYSGVLAATTTTLPTGSTALAYSLTDVSGDVAVGHYPITVTLGDNPNYAITTVAGLLTITPADAPTTLSDASFTYDGTALAGGATELTATAAGQSVALTSADITVVNDGVNAGTYAYALSATGLTKLQAAVGDNYTVTAADATGTITIAPYAVTITAPTLTKVYDGEAYTGDVAATTTALPENGASLNYALTDVSDDTNVGTYDIAVTTGSNPNYTVTTQAGSLTITPATNATKLNDGTLTYDGATTASDASGLTATAAGQTVTLTAADIAVEDDGVNASTYTYTLTATGLAKLQVAVGDNYAVTVGGATGTITIAPYAVTITAPTLAKVYDGEAYANEVTATTTTLPESGATLNYTLTDISGDTNVGTYDITVTAGSNPNYTVTTVAGTLTITPADSTTTLTDASFIYDGSTTASDARGLTATAAGQTIALTATDVTVEHDDGNAGSYTYTLNATGLAKLQATVGDNYTVEAADATGTITIDPYAVTITAPTLTKVYDGDAYAGDVTATTSTLPENGESLNYTLTDLGDDKNVGTYDIDITTGSNPNYTVTTQAGTLAITPANASTTLTDSSFVYDGSTTASAATGLTASAAGQSIALTAADIAVEDDGVNAGTYTYALNATGLAKLQAAVGNNYTVTAADTIGTITIDPYAVTITAPTLTKVFDGEAYEGDVAATTSTLPENGASLNYTLTAVSDDTNVGTYAIAVTAGSNPNYTITTQAGSLTITPVNATLSLNDVTFTYDGVTPASEATGLTATAAGQTVNLSQADLTVVDDGVNAGEYAYTLNATGLAKVQAAVGANYLVNTAKSTRLRSATTTSGTITIAPYAVTITAPTLHKVYDGVGYTDAVTATTTGIPLNGTALNYTLTDLTADSQVGTYAVEVTLGTNANYAVTTEDGVLTISPAVAKTTLNDATFTYNGVTTAGATTGLTATAAGQTIALTQADITVGNDGVDAGSYTYTLNATGLAKVQAAVGANYTASLASNTGTITITPAAGTISLGTVTRAFDGQPASDSQGLTATVTGLNGTSTTVPLTSTDITVQADSANTGTYTYDLSAAGLAKLQAVAGQNIALTAPTSTKTITIIPAVTTAQAITVTRTITYTGAGKQTPAAVQQAVTYSAQTVTDQNGAVTTYTPGGNFAAVQSPTIAGYHASGDVAAVMLAQTTEVPASQTLTITYIAEATKLEGNGNGQQGTGTTSGKATGEPDAGTTGTHSAGTAGNGQVARGNGQRTASDTAVTTGSSVAREPQPGTVIGKRLPKTGDLQNTWLTGLGVSVLGLFSLFGLAERKRRRKD